MPSPFPLRSVLSLLFLSSALIAHAAEPRYGDSGWEPDEARFDDRFPAMREWARAGVRGGIPARDATPVIARVAPGDDVPSALDSAAAAGGGVVLLIAGDHELTTPWHLPSGVILRGESRDTTRILVRLKAPFFRTSGQPQMVAIRADHVSRVGVEDLTVRYAAVDFEPHDFNDPAAPWQRHVFHRPEDRDPELHVHLLIFHESEDFWVDGCAFLWAGAHPLGARRCLHVTFRDNFIDRAYVKNDGAHGGYYGIWGTRHSLFINESVHRIRHFALMSPGCRYNVVLGGDFTTDLNFHHADDGHNLIEGASFVTPVWHSWNAVARGAPGQHLPPGPGNILFNVTASSKGVPGFTRSGPVPEPGVVYEVNPSFESPTDLVAGTTLAGAIALTLGIGLQNVPEGLAVAMPLRQLGRSKRRAFFFGQASAAVEPVAAVLGAVLVIQISWILPYALAFAAGAMIFVAVEELIPESQSHGNTDLATMATIVGFTVMMCLDVGLG